MTTKLAVGFVAAAMLFSASVAPASAQSTADLQAQIQALLSQIAQLQAQLGGGTSGAGVCPFTWTRDLTQGSTGEDVRKLQQFLNTDPETRVAVSGAGSAGAETTFYGPATAAAVSKFQVKYRAEVLTPGGLVNPTGYFGPSSRAKANSLCSTGSPTTPTPGGPLQGGEGYLDDADSLGDIEAVLDEGQRGNVVGVGFEAVDSDIRIERVDVEFDLVDSAGSTRLDRYITDVALYLDGDRLATMSASNSSRSGSVHSVRFTGLNGVVREGDTAELYVEVRAVNTIGQNEENEDIIVTIPRFGIRAVDGSGLSETYFNEDFTETFSISEAAGGDLSVTESEDNPDARVVEVSDSTTTSNVELLRFDAEADEQDVTIINLPVVINTSTTTTATVQSVSLRRGSTVIQTKSIPSSATSTSLEVIFDGIDFDIEEGDTETFSVVALVKREGQSNTFESGATISASTTASAWDVEDVEGDVVNASGSAEGELVTLMTEGVSVSFVSATESKSSSSATTTENGTFVIKFNVTAFGQTAYISATSTASTTVDYDVVGGGADVAVLTSNASRVGDAFRVNDGQSREFTLTVNVTGNGEFNSVNLDRVGFGSSPTSTTGSFVPTNDAVFTTDPLFLAN